MKSIGDYDKINYRGVQYVEHENILSKDISNTEEKAALDASCKRLLANKIILAWILKSCVKEYCDCNINDIAEKYIEGEPQIGEIAVYPNETNSEIINGMSNEDRTLNEGTVTYDIRFMSVAPASGDHIRLIINIEAQNDFYPGYPLMKRVIYYCSRMVSAQYGTEFTNSHYENIKKVYSIWICVNPPKNRENSITSYSIAENSIVGDVHEKSENYDLMTAVIICLGAENDQNYDGVLKLLEVLLSSDRLAEEKKLILTNDFNIKMTQKLDEEVSVMCNISKGVEAKGMEKGILNSIRNLMDSMKLTAEQAMAALRVPESEYKKYEDMLKQSNTNV